MKHSSHTQYKAVFCDIDGTLLTTDHRITDRTKEKIQDIHRSGIPFILVSARMPAGIDPIQKELGIKAPIISYGGALILDEEGRPISSTGLSLSLAEKIRAMFRKKRKIIASVPIQERNGLYPIGPIP